MIYNDKSHFFHRKTVIGLRRHSSLYANQRAHLIMYDFLSPRRWQTDTHNHTNTQFSAIKRQKNRSNSSNASMFKSKLYML